LTISNHAFAAGDIVWVSFPFVDAPRLRDRPALVVSNGLLGGEAELLWVLMITSAANRGWPGDILLETRFAECGLNVPCVIRTAKISTVEAVRARKTGALPDDLYCEVRQVMKAHLNL
jgi:mRNA interferase MazF